MASALLMSGPAAAWAASSLAWRWCFPERGLGSLPLLAAVLAFRGILDDAALTQAIMYAWLKPTWSPMELLPILVQLSAFVCLTTSGVMLVVLLFEVPWRWCGAAFVGVEERTFVTQIRWMLFGFVASLGWYLIVENYNSRTDSILRMMVASINGS